VIDAGARIVVQGATGREARMVVGHMLAYGTAVAAGVTPGRAGVEVDGVPVFDRVADASAAILDGAPFDISLVSVPPAAALGAACEALEAGIVLLVVATENMPRLDVARLLARAREHSATVVGPNSVGVICPRLRLKVGAIGGDDADRAFAPGPVAVISRSGGLTVETALQLRLAGIGVSTAVSVGGDAMVGTPPAPLAARLAADGFTRAIVVVGEPGTRHELDLADAVAAGEIAIPVIAHVPGRFTESFPRGARFGHAGAIIGDDDERPSAKAAALAAAGVHVAETYDQIVPLVQSALAMEVQR
jgi:succinyl-CoA synthetase alpha subunit